MKMHTTGEYSGAQGNLEGNGVRVVRGCGRTKRVEEKVVAEGGVMGVENSLIDIRTGGVPKGGKDHPRAMPGVERLARS